MSETAEELIDSLVKDGTLKIEGRPWSVDRVAKNDDGSRTIFLTSPQPPAPEIIR